MVLKGIRRKVSEIPERWPKKLKNRKEQKQNVEVDPSNDNQGNRGVEPLADLERELL